MLTDWNFWLSIITAGVAIIAVRQTARQMKLSNKHRLFDRRLRVYTIVQGLLRLYAESRSLLLEKPDKPQLAMDFDFLMLTNNTFMEQISSAIENPLKPPYHQDFLRKKEELHEIAAEIPLIFFGNEADDYSQFVSCYELLLFRMYQYQIVITNIKEESEKHPNTIERLSKMFDEPETRKQLYDAIDSIETIYQCIVAGGIELKIKEQIKLV